MREINENKGELSFYFNNEKEPILVISKGKFIWKGKEIKDTKKIYERFNEWLIEAGKPELK